MNIKKERKKFFTFRNISSFFYVLLFFLAFQNYAFAADIDPEQSFLVDKGYDFYSRSQVDAALLHESDNAYFYFEKQYYDSMSPLQKEKVISKIKKLGEEFDSIIYPKTKEVFGEEWNPGIDDEEKIIIFFVRLNSTVGGYFNPNDEYLKGRVVDDRSNESEMIYLNPDFLGTQKVEGFLAHELQHMIYWNERTRLKGVSDDIWINEARSELASSLTEEATGKDFLEGNLYIRKRDFLLNYDDSIADWNNTSGDYASAGIFIQYIKEQFGSAIFREMNPTKKAGLNNLDYVIKQKGSSLDSVFMNWTIANFINDATIDSKYGYQNKNLKYGFNVEPEVIYDKNNDQEINLTAKIEDWSSAYYEVDLDDSQGNSLYIEINFNGEDTGDFSLPIIINYKDGSRKIDSLNLDYRGAGNLDLLSADNEISSIIFIPSCHNINDMVKSNQITSYSIALDIKFTYTKDKILPDGTLVKTSGNEKVYLIENGQKKWIVDSATFVSRGYKWSDILIISETELKIYSEGVNIKMDVAIADKTLIKGAGPEIYLIENSQRRWIKDEYTFSSYGFDWKQVVTLTNQELLQYAEGETLSKNTFANGALIKGSGPMVYMIENGQKRWITSPEAFNRNRFNWSSVVMVSEREISFYGSGPNID